MIRKISILLGGAVLAATLALAAGPAAAQDKKVTIALPGIPPIFSVTIVYVAEKEGFFKKHGVDVEIRPFDNGTAAARAVVAGNVEMSWSPTPPVINQISNAGVPLVAGWVAPLAGPAGAEADGRAAVVGGLVAVAGLLPVLPQARQSSAAVKSAAPVSQPAPKACFIDASSCSCGPHGVADAVQREPDLGKRVRVREAYVALTVGAEGSARERGHAVLL